MKINLLITNVERYSIPGSTHYLPEYFSFFSNSTYLIIRDNLQPCVLALLTERICPRAVGGANDGAGGVVATPELFAH